MANTWEKAIPILAVNLNLGLSYLITAVLTASFAIPTVYHKKIISLNTQDGKKNACF